MDARRISSRGCLLVLPRLTLYFRRLHDLNIGGGFCLILYVPLLVLFGYMTLLSIFMATDNFSTSVSLASFGPFFRVFLPIICLIAELVFFVMYCFSGTMGDNRYGADSEI